jgi:hypothetical protein
MWIRGNHKKRYTTPSAWHLYKQHGIGSWFVLASESSTGKGHYEDKATVKSVDGYSWWESESESSEELPKKGKICGKCLQVYLNEGSVRQQSN